MSNQKPLRWRIVPREGDKAHLLMECEKGCNRGGEEKECIVSLWKRPPQHPMWSWNGDVVTPTITPSIDCQGGCGRHFNMIAGVAVGAG